MPSVDTPPPRITTAEVAEYVRTTYRLNVTVKHLVSDIGQNFYLTEASGKTYVFKIANPSEHEDMLDAQNAVLEYLTEHRPRFAYPRVVPTSNGGLIAEITGKDASRYRARLLKYVPGKSLADVRLHPESLLEDIGVFLGEMDKALEGFDHPAAHRYWHWDLRNAGDLGRLTKHIAEPLSRRLVEYFLLRFESEVLPLLPDLRTSLIHGDANDHNLLLKDSDQGTLEVAGIIDFGDMVHSQTICELAIALAYVMAGKADPLASAIPMVRGYHASLPLRDVELEVLLPLVTARLCATVTFCAYQQKIQSDNAYLSISDKPARHLLNELLTISPEKANRVFRLACGLSSTAQRGRSREEILDARKLHIGKSLSTSYRSPLKIVRGAMQYLFDEKGNTYLDCVNNVCHIGHCHPQVVKAAQKQIAILNTNTRYLHDNLAEYALRLTDTMPDPLTVCYFVNSGSEANELAIRLARAYTGHSDFIVVDQAYHGNTTATIELSPYKFDGPGGMGRPSHIQKVIMPDSYRGPYRYGDLEAGAKYAQQVGEAASRIRDLGRGIAGFFCESHMGVGGQIILPDGYLQNAYAHVRESGGVCIADEVQVGFGRLGSQFWGFQTQGVIPDIVTLGKPIGNGHPLGAVVTTPAIADAFATGMEYFNTFGGNPVSCAVGSAVLQVIEEEELQHNAATVGRHLKSGLESLKETHSLIGDVRGLGLFVGVELVRNRENLDPASEEAAVVIERMKDRCVLLSVDGPYHNVLKIKPPIVFSEENADHLVELLDEILG
jgi:4-aminobutyrate aminotransferase-like enzyme